MPCEEIGVGVVYFPGLEPLLKREYVDVVEVEPQTLWRLGSDGQYTIPRRSLDFLSGLPQPKVVHSVGHAIGGTRRPPMAFVSSLKNTIDVLKAPWASDHLSFTTAGEGDAGFHTSFMLPPLQSKPGVEVAVSRIQDLRRQLAVPLAVETGVNYLAVRPGELTDGQFLASVVDGADCGIVLDLHNIWANERNGRQSVSSFLKSIPLERVWEIHVAGGFEFDGYWLDSHSGAIPPLVMEWARKLVPSLPNLKAVVYEIFPSFIPLFGLGAIQSELGRVRTLWQARQKRSSSRGKHPGVLSESPGAPRVHACDDHTIEQIDPAQWERAVASVVISKGEGTRLAEDLAKDPAILLIRKLIWRFRAGAVAKAHDALIQLLLASLGPDHLEQLLDGYFDAARPELMASEEARGFAGYLAEQSVDVPYLQDVLRYEEARIRAQESDCAQYLRFEYDPRQLVAALAEGRLPDDLSAGHFELEVLPQ